MSFAIDAPTVCELARLVRDGELTAAEVVETALRRAETTEPELAAFTLIAADRALQEARALDAEAAAGRWRGPLHGVPIAVKDLFDVEGEVTGAGSRLPPTGLAAQADADPVARLRAAGAVVLGRTRTHEYAWGLTTQHPQLGGTRNPWNPQRVPGGSSGGSAAAVAAGVVPLGLGTDTAGSIRLPAAWCGLVGHKPTHGRVSLAGVVPLAPSFDHGGALVRTVDDARLALSLLLGTELVSGPRSVDVTGVRVGVVANGAPRADASVRAVLDVMLGRSVDAGVRLADVKAPEWTRMRDTFFALQASEALRYHRELGHWPERADLYGDDVRGRLRRAESFTEADIAAARKDLVGMHREVAEVFTSVDVLLQLVAGSGPSETGSPDEVRVDDEPADLREHVLPRTLLASLCGLPACSIPVGTDRDGLPVGLQVVGARGQDGLVLDVAEGLLALGR